MKIEVSDQKVVLSLSLSLFLRIAEGSLAELFSPFSCA